MQNPEKPDENDAVPPVGTSEPVGHVSVNQSRLQRVMHSHAVRRLLISLTVLIGTALLLGLFGGFVLNGIITRRVVESVNSRPGQHLVIGNVSINILTGSVDVRDIALRIDPPAAAAGVDSLRIIVPEMSVEGVERISLLLANGLHADGITINSLRMGIYRGEQIDTVVLPQTDTTETYLETGLLASLAESLPERISPMTIDHVELTNASLFRSRRFDGQTVRDSITSFDLMVDDLNSQPLSHSPDKPGYYSRMELKGRGIVLQLARGVYTANLASLDASTEDSLMTVRSFRIDPALSVDRFFDTATGRLSRFTVSIPEVTMHGVQFHRMWYSEISMREMNAEAPAVNVLSDRRHPRSPDLPRPRMPVEFIDAIKPLMVIDSLHARRGRVVYSELNPGSDRPGVVRFDDITVDVAGINTRVPATGRGTAIFASGRLYDSARVHLIMDIPLASNAPIYYEGWLEPISALRLNEFLLPAEHTQVTTGQIDRITFTVRIQGGRAVGTVTPTWHDLSATLLEIPGADETGIKGWIKRTAAQNFSVISANPLPGDTVRVGQIDYGRELDQAFFGFIWNALWDGIRKVVGV